MKATFIALLAATILSQTGLTSYAATTEFNFLHEHPGGFTASVSSQHYLKKSEATTYRRNLALLRDLLARQPVFQPPRGIEVKGYFRPNDTAPKNAKMPLTGFGYLTFYFYFQDHKTGRPVSICCSDNSIAISVNDPGNGLEPFNATWFPSLVLYEPKQVGEMGGGFRVYRTRGGSEVILLNRSGMQPWQPLTREEFIKGEIARLQKEVSESPPVDTITPQILKNHQAALAAMPAEERKLQARYFAWDPFQPMLAPAGSDQGDPLVRIRPDWYDSKLPRTAFQLITLNFGFGGSIDPDDPKPPKSDNIAPYRLWEALHTSDWRSVSGALTDK